MTPQEAQAFIGELVYTTCPGPKLVVSQQMHGPYVLLQVTKAGRCILQGREEFRPTASQIFPLLTYEKAN